MSKRHGRPGMAPSPNQKIVLDDLKNACHDGHWITIDGVHLRLVLQRLGGYEDGNGWYPWHRSTVRDHLNDLVLKGLAEKEIQQRVAAYRPVANV